VADSNGEGVRAAAPIGLRIFSKLPFPVENAYSSLCAFAIKYERANTLSSPLSKILDIPLVICGCKK